jgi:hypothetical protein
VLCECVSRIVALRECVVCCVLRVACVVCCVSVSVSVSVR